MFYVENNNFQDIYSELVSKVLTEGQDIEVRGQKTKELIFISLCLTDTSKYKLDFSNTRAHSFQSQYDKYCKDEIEWYKSGSLKFTDAPSQNIWPDIADAIGNIQSNYGHIILHKQNLYTKSTETAFNLTLSLLKRDRYSRQAILHYNLPEHYINIKDIPCTISTQILIRENKLNFIVYQRSCDLRHGLIYDLPWHCFLMQKYITELFPIYDGLSSGNLSMTFGSLHIYNKKRDIEFFQNYRSARE